MVGAAACDPVPDKRETIAPARTASPAALPTRTIGTPSTTADAEGHGLGAVLLISRGRPCECGTMTRGWRRCGTEPHAAADAERRGPADQDPDHGQGLLRMRNRIGVPIQDCHKCKRTMGHLGTGTSTGALLCVYAGMRIQRYGHMIICGYAHRSICPLCVKPHGKIDQGPDTPLAGP